MTPEEKKIITAIHEKHCDILIKYIQETVITRFSLSALLSNVVTESYQAGKESQKYEHETI